MSVYNQSLLATSSRLKGDVLLWAGSDCWERVEALVSP